jgi:hypothetical protein
MSLRSPARRWNKSVIGATSTGASCDGNDDGERLAVIDETEDAGQPERPDPLAETQHTGKRHEQHQAIELWCDLGRD